MMKRMGPLAVALLLAGCASAPPPSPAPPLALPAPTGDPLNDVAALLAVADSTDDPQLRAPLIERLDALDVRLADGAADDPLALWRAEHPANEANPWRGRALGPAYRRARVAPGEKLRIEQVFLAGERARIAAEASGGGEVALAINNPRAEAVCQQQLAPRGMCNWLPIYTERFSIELENTGSAPASVYIVFR